MQLWVLLSIQGLLIWNYNLEGGGHFETKCRWLFFFFLVPFYYIRQSCTHSFKMKLRDYVMMYMQHTVCSLFQMKYSNLSAAAEAAAAAFFNGKRSCSSCWTLLTKLLGEKKCLISCPIRISLQVISWFKIKECLCNIKVTYGYSHFYRQCGRYLIN